MLKTNIYSVLVCMALCACAALVEIPEAGDLRIIENVPFFPQEDFQCGPASLAMVLNYRGVHVAPDDIAKEIFSESAGGTLTIDMVLYAQKRGLSAFQYKGSMEELKESIASGYPVIVLVDYGYSFYKRNHYMVVKGYNKNGVIVNSGRNKDKFIAEQKFLKIWEKTNFWTLIINTK
jgi:ABC-type bacteriocin/lantibiotic exporter with double-glycine peptidase domain